MDDVLTPQFVLFLLIKFYSLSFHPYQYQSEQCVCECVCERVCGMHVCVCEHVCVCVCIFCIVILEPLSTLCVSFSKNNNILLITFPSQCTECVLYYAYSVL